MWTIPWIKLSWHFCSMWDKHGWIHWYWQFLCEEYLPLIWKDCFSYRYTCSLCEVRTSFHTGLISRKLCGFLFMFLTVFFFHSVSLLFPLPITSFAFMKRFWCYLYLIHLLDSVKIFLTQMALLRRLPFLLGYLTVTLLVLFLFWI